MRNCFIVIKADSKSTLEEKFIYQSSKTPHSQTSEPLEIGEARHQSNSVKPKPSSRNSSLQHRKSLTFLQKFSDQLSTKHYTHRALAHTRPTAFNTAIPQRSHSVQPLKNSTLLRKLACSCEKISIRFFYELHYRQNIISRPSVCTCSHTKAE